jgi:hypothetical protein
VRYFRCGTCLGLTYASWHESKAERRLNRLFQKRRKLGGSGSLFEPFPPKPKGMRWRNYLRLFEEDERNQGPYLEDAAGELARGCSRAVRKFEKRSKQGAPTPKKPKRATTAHALSPDELAVAFALGNITAKRETKPTSGP